LLTAAADDAGSLTDVIDDDDDAVRDVGDVESRCSESQLVCCSVYTHTYIDHTGKGKGKRYNYTEAHL